ncbi:MAG: hypothetical protein PVG39_01385 [Desulfobacteraceae bacterium]|jgi:hypothetical protein
MNIKIVKLSKEANPQKAFRLPFWFCGAWVAQIRIDPESEKGKSIKRKILRLLDSDNILPLDFLVLDLAMETGLSWPRIQEILTIQEKAITPKKSKILKRVKE